MHERYGPVTAGSIDAVNNVYSELYHGLDSHDDEDPLPKDGSAVFERIFSRLELPIHRMMSYQSTVNTLKYLFFHMRCGILVSIRKGKIVLFAPFVNKDYTNNWGNRPEVDSEDGTLDKYYAMKESREKFLYDKSKWWANGNIICNVYDNDGEGSSSATQWWGDHFLFQLKDMISETCRLREVPDCDFFVNKRDYPQLKYNDEIGPVEPYGFIYDCDDRDPSEDVPLSRHVYRTYAPIM
jgi:hypothetical protein